MGLKEIGGAALGAASSAMKASAAKKAQKREIAAQKEIEHIRGQEDRLTDAARAELEDKYSQLNKKRRKEARTGVLSKYSSFPKEEAPLDDPTTDEDNPENRPAVESGNSPARPVMSAGDVDGRNNRPRLRSRV